MSAFSMPTTPGLVQAASVTVALSAVRMYYFGVGGYSLWCAAAGIIAAEVSGILSLIPSSVAQYLNNQYVSAAQAVVMIAGGMALELAVGAQFEMNASGAEQFAGGAVAAYVGLYVADMINNYLAKSSK